MKNRLKKLALLLLGWSLVAIITTSQIYLELVTYNQPADLKRLFLTQFLQWNFWVAATPFIGWLAKRFRIESGRWVKGLAVHIPTSVFVAASHISYIVFISTLLAPADPQGRTRTFFQFFLGLSYTYHIELLIYWAILGATYAFDYYKKYRERELRASQLEAQLSQANLQALRMQLQPHFLFNTLNAIATLVRDNQNKAAIEMIVGVSELLRQVLDKMGQQEVTLKEEMEFIERYLEIQQMRFGERLKVDTQIAPDTLDCLVPNLVLQPIVENAIRHGLSPRKETGYLVITSGREGERLRLSVFNNGVLLQENWNMEEAHGLGLSNTRARLEQLYNHAQEFSLCNMSDGVMATIKLPLHVSTNGRDEN